jgi:hypothetical protein
VALTVPRLRTHQRGSRCVVNRPPTLLSEDIGCTLKGGVKVCQRQLVNEVLGLPVTEFALNLAREGATPIQRPFRIRKYVRRRRAAKKESRAEALVFEAEDLLLAHCQILLCSLHDALELRYRSSGPVYDAKLDVAAPWLATKHN